MSRRTRRSPIRPEQRREWLQRIEEGGELPPQIANSANVDVRTIRKHLAMAKQEREAREAKVLVLRNAMELHYSDLLKFVEKLNSQILGKGRTKPGPDDEFIEVALRQHIPRSPIWGYRQKKEMLQMESKKHLKQIEGIMAQTANADVKLTPLVNKGLPQIVSFIAKTITSQALRWSEGATELHLIDNLRVENTQDGLAEFRLGPDVIGKVNRKHVEEYFKIVCDVCADMESILIESDLYHEFEATRAEIKSLDRKLHEELAKIRLKRIVPGHCDLCPL
jgi:hypothetical protein